MKVRAIQGLAMGLTAVITVGCATRAVMVRTDYDRSANVGRYVTFFMVDGNSTGDEAIDQLIKSDVESALASQGWVEAPPDEGQAIVIAHAVTAAKQSADALYAGWGGWQWRIGGGPAATTPVEPYQVGSVVVDIFDARTRQAIWRGVATDAVPMPTPAGARKTMAAINKMFTTFPTAAMNDNGDLREFNDRQRPAVDEAPRLIFSPTPAVLVSVRGEPLYREIAGTPLKRIINTRALIVRNDAGMHYLKIRDGWMEAYALTDWWSTAGTGPEDANTVLAQAVDAMVVDPHGGGVYVSTTPAALIVTDGEPRFAPVNGTSLAYVTNTTAHIFQEPTDQELYVLLSGRWLRAWTTAGPWQYVPDSDLPADFARIPGELLNKKESAMLKE